MLDLGNLNWLAIGAATVLGMALGALWYSPVLFGNAWLAAIGKTEEELVSPGPAMAGSLLACLLSALTMALLIGGLGATTLWAGAMVGALVGIGIVAMALLSDNLFCGWGWPLYFIQTGYRLLYLILMGAVLGAWQ